MTYKVRKTNGGDIVECALCGSDTATADFRKSVPPTLDEKHPLCRFCAGTHIGALLEYPHNRDHAPIARAMAQCFNILFDRKNS